MSDKNLKIWGVSYGPLGDLIMGLPILTYFEKKYPNSYKYYVIQKRSSICAPLYINHPLIDKIKVTDNPFL
jgi:ADP-heptose:LPS heptosyltransferase